MFILMPWNVDVPQDRWPVVNWIIIVVLIGVFTLQVRDAVEARTDLNFVHDPPRRSHDPAHRQELPADPHQQRDRELPGITERLLLRDWDLTGPFGHMWIHGGILHLAGNLLFLWIFGNALCAKLGNVRYLFLYVLCGVAAGVVHLWFTSRPALGASGAINGVVGMYLVLFYENEITCLFVWFWPFYVRFFDVSSIWMILFRLFWDIVGALRGRPGVAYFAHLGGFATGFSIVMFMCWRGWIMMERHEGSLLDAWRKRRETPETNRLNVECARLGLPRMDELGPERLSARAEAAQTPRPPVGQTRDDSIRFACTCGRRIKTLKKHAGRFGTCPQCGLRLRVPQPPSDSV
ncbi:MAG: rhomboid family intramembrane serine protease [Phycisphaerales bacterium]